MTYTNWNQVRDDGSPIKRTSANITVRVTDANDAPVFKVRNPKFEVYENVAVNTSLTGVGLFQNGSKLEVYDEDKKDTLYWSITKNELNMFRINHKNGTMMVANSPNYEAHPQAYSITVQVADAAGATDSVEVTINVLDVNEEPVTTYSTANVAEDAAADTSLGLPAV